MSTPRQRKKQQSRPREGTKAAMVYDHFIANEGEPVETRELSRLVGITATEVNAIVERLNMAYDIFILNQGKGYYILLTEKELV